MRPQHRHPHAGHAYGNPLVLEDLARFLDDFALFVVVTGVGVNSGVVAEDVEGVGMRDHLRREGPPVEAGAGRFLQFLHRRRTGAAGRLIGRQDHALDAVLLVDWPQRHQRRDRRAIRVGDDALVIPDAVSVDLGDHQRHVRIHPEGRGIVDHDGAGLHCDWRVLSGNAAASRKQRDVDAMEGVRGQLLDKNPLAAEVDGLAGRAGARQRLELADAEIALVHGGDEFGADSAGYTDNGYNGIVRHFGLSSRFAGNKKAPVLFGRGFGSD